MPSEARQKFYLTTPIYYVNARPHIGHAYTTIVADVLARRHRLLGDDVFFLTGTDEHGQKIERSAAAAGIPPQQFADRVAAQFQTLWDRMGLTYSKFIRTTDPAHAQGVQKLFSELYARGFIYLSSYTGAYCVSDEAFVDVPVGAPCPECGRTTEQVTEENFFFKLSAFQAQLINLIETGVLAVEPESRRNEVLSFLRGNVSAAGSSSADTGIQAEAKYGNDGVDSSHASPSGLDNGSSDAGEPRRLAEIAYSDLGTPYVPGALKDLSISRSSFTWGIPVPAGVQKAAGVTQNHVIYVWLDALANYMTAIGYGASEAAAQAEFAKYWPADLHLVGKEIIRFHCVYWPAFLLAAGLPLPRAITAHGWLLFDNSKMSKSKGNIVRTETILQAFGTLCPPVHEASSSASNVTPVHQASASNGTPVHEASSSASNGTPVHEASSSASNVTPVHQASSSASNGTPVHQASSSASNVTPVILSGEGAPSAPSQSKDPEAARLASTAEPFPTSNSPRPPTPAERDLFASDVLRYFLLREIPFGQDGSFSFDALITRYNADLANGYGNLVSRTLGLLQQTFSQGIRVPTNLPWLCVETHSASEAFNPENLLSGPDTAFVISTVEEFVRLYVPRLLDTNTFGLFLAELSARISIIDGYISFHKPWKLAKSHTASDREKLAELLYTAAESIRILTALLYPVLPYATARVWAQLGLGDIEAAARNGELNNLQWGGLRPGTRLGPLTPIFPRADKGLAQIMTDMEDSQLTADSSKLASKPDRPEAPLKQAITPAPAAPVPADPTHPAAPPVSLDEPSGTLPVAGSHATTTAGGPTPAHTEAQPSGAFASAASQAPITAAPADASPQITIDDFARVELRVAEIKVCERIPKADKLLRLEVDLGHERRQILSGIAEFYTPDELLGRRIVVITNLAPRKMRGLDSHGMLLAASGPEGGKPILATVAEGVPLGSRLK